MLGKNIEHLLDLRSQLRGDDIILANTKHLHEFCIRERPFWRIVQKRLGHIVLHEVDGLWVESNNPTPVEESRRKLLSCMVEVDRCDETHPWWNDQIIGTTKR